VPDGTPHFRRNVHAGIVVVVELVEVVVVVPKMVELVEVEVNVVELVVAGCAGRRDLDHPA
jgi:hypothetical protein